MADDATTKPRTLTLADLPRARAGSPVALPGTGRWIKGNPRSIELPRIGSVRLTFVGIAASAPDDESVLYAYAHAGAGGTIRIARLMAGRIVAAVLRTKTPLMDRALGRAERGVLGAVVAETLRLLGSPWQLSLRSAPVADARDQTTLAATIEALGATSSVQVDVPAALLSAGNELDADGLASLPTDASLELARTQLAMAEWTAVRPGDAVVFDGVAVLPAAEPWPARLRVGFNAAPATVDAGGAVRLRGEFRPLAIASGRILRNKGGRMDDDTKEGGAVAVEPTQVLAAAPVEIVAELGRVCLRGEEVLSLARGGVLSFGGLRATAIALRVGDEIWARGELVDVEGELGVRITELTAAHPAGGGE